MVHSLTTRYVRADALPGIRDTLLNVHSDAYAGEIARNPFFLVERFSDRLESQVKTGDLELPRAGHAR